MIHHQDFAVVIDQWLQHIRICVPNLVTDVDGAAADSPQQAVLNGIVVASLFHETKKQRMVNYMKVKKIETTLPLKVQGQACTNNCEEKIWAGKKEADGWEAGCWYTIGYTACGAWW